MHPQTATHQRAQAKDCTTIQRRACAPDPMPLAFVDARFERDRRLRDTLRSHLPKAENSISSKLVAVVMLKGANEDGATEAMKKLQEEKPNLVFQRISAPEELPRDAALIVFVANGTTEGADAFLKGSERIREKERIGTVLVSEHRDGTDRFDCEMTFEWAIARGRLLSAMSIVHARQRGEYLN